MSPERLTALDTAFLHVEDKAAHMHVGGVLVFDGDPPHYDDLVASVSARLDRLPRYRQRLAWPAGALLRPCWVEDPRFDVRRHVSHAGLPQPHGEAQLRDLAGRLFGEPLDRRRPLWELHLVDGMRGGRFAVVAKIHHALADGISGVDIAALLLDVEADAQTPPVRAHDAPPVPSATALLVEGAAGQLRDTASGIAGSLRSPRRTLGKAVRAAQQAPHLVTGGSAGSYCRPIGAHRRFATVRTSVDELRSVRDRHGVTVNDLVLAAVAGALRRHLLRSGDVPDSVTAMVPVSNRPDADRGALGNQITSMYVALPTGEADVRDRLTRTAAAVAACKEADQAAAVGALAAAGDAAPPPLMALLARGMASPRLFDLTVTNIPGPSLPLYLLGRPLDDVFPMVPLARDHALGVAVMSYRGRLDFGLVACADAVPDLDDLAGDLRVSLEELRALGRPSRARRQRRFERKDRLPVS